MGDKRARTAEELEQAIKETQSSRAANLGATAFGTAAADDDDNASSAGPRGAAHDSLAVSAKAAAAGSAAPRRLVSSFTAPKDVFDDVPHDEDHDPFAETRTSRSIASRETEYQQRRFARKLSPERKDVYASSGTDASKRDGASYAQVMAEAEVERETAAFVAEMRARAAEDEQGSATHAAPRKRSRSAADAAAAAADSVPGPADAGAKRARLSRWDETPVAATATSAVLGKPRSRWDETPVAGAASAVPGKPRSRWDETPVAGALAPKTASSRWDQTPAVGSASSSGRWDQTPVMSGHAMPGMLTPTPGGVMGTTPDMRWRMELDARNRYLTDEELDAMFPAEGYEVLTPPKGYAPPVRANKLLTTPTPMAAGGVPGATPLYVMPAEAAGSLGAQAAAMGMEVSDDLPFVKPEDYQHFQQLLDDKQDSELSREEAKERAIMRLLLKIKNGTPPMRKAALRSITDQARSFGAGPLFNQILPLLMSPTLEDQERHLLVKVIDRILYKLDDLVRPYVHNILVVIEPLLIDEDQYARIEGREIISNLAKAAGLPTMISTMRPDIDNPDEYVRNTTARAFAVVALALGVPSLLPFLKAVCRSRKSWMARHTGIKIVQQMAILMGCGLLPHLRNVVDVIQHGLKDEQPKVRTMTALAIAALAEAAFPYGIESFDTVIKPLWIGVRKLRGKGLAAFLKAIGFLIPLMDEESASYYTREVMVQLIREFAAPEDEMKRIVLKVVKQCIQTDGVEPAYVREEVLPDFMQHFWVRAMALDRRNYAQLVETTVELARKVGGAEVIRSIVAGLKDDSEPYRKMVMDAIERIVRELGAADVDQRLEELLIDGVLFVFQEQQGGEASRVLLDGFGTVVNALGVRVKPYLPQIAGTIRWRLNNKSDAVRQQAADLISKTAGVMKLCDEDAVLAHLGQVLYEYLGEEYPQVLGSILGALKAIVNVIGMDRMQPPIKELLPRLTPILRNRMEKVQENSIALVGRIADRGASYVSGREWMRICFELLDMLKAHKKSIRAATLNTFGFIARAIGPFDVLSTLLNNLKVQDRQNRVCTTVAVAIVAEICFPFTVLPALMNEYKVPELNVQNGVLKSLSFLFEYIGEMGRDYVYAVTPLITDALMDRDQVHRQTAASVVKHMALGVVGLNCEEAMLHLLNYVWPNIFEKSPHVINAVMEAVEALRVALGPVIMMQYLLQGLFHPSRRVRQVYWKIYNTMYVASQDAMVAAYPGFPDEPEDNLHYARHELEMWL